ncbi:elongation factor P maturation arginine rhamnosyltransferase EarP [Roseateles sp. BYS180W]|uniref:Protein-arginine rhamnosyltransferase n=1 Tax=Roseateles rivi TaxID=3299028 RepID=A0ABW7FV59_9BURK
MPTPLPESAPCPLGAGPLQGQRWDLFCRVIDNHGDLGVNLRLARALVAAGAGVRLWCDDDRALSWMQPRCPAALSCLPWAQAEQAAPPQQAADVVLETFGCELPLAYVQAMQARRLRGEPPVWINLEYLSAEDYVERSHGLASPQWSGAAAGLQKWFFYPGFTPRTGGLLREAGMVENARALRQQSGHPWLAQRGWAPQAGERVLSLFAYQPQALAELLQALPGPWLLLLCPGVAQQQAPALLGPQQRAMALPYLSHTDYDQLLASCDFNLVRGEDSFVRAHWADAPLLWHIYPQHDQAHAAKLQAYWQRALAGADAQQQARWWALSQAWNGLAPWTDEASAALAHLDAAAQQARHWRQQLCAQADLLQQLLNFVQQHRCASAT